MKTTTKKPDRISRACDLIRAGVTLDDNNRIQSTSGHRYTVQGCRCTCPDARPDSAGVRRICKHVWSTTGRPAALAIDYFRNADTLDALRAHGLALAAHVPGLPQNIVDIARHEYRLAFHRLATSTERRMAA